MRNDITNNIVYATLKPSAIRAPSPMIILCNGVYYDYGNKITFDLANIPYEAESSPDINPYNSGFMNIDCAQIFIWLLSFIAIMISFDTITKEKDEGTIKLLFSNNLTVKQFILIKIISSFITISIILFPIMVINLLLFGIYPWIDINGLLIGKIVLFYAYSCIYAFLWCLICIAISRYSKNSGISLITSLAMWVLLIMIIPGGLQTFLGMNNLEKEKVEILSYYNKRDKVYNSDLNKVIERTIEPLIRELKFGTMGGGPGGGEPIWFPNEATLKALEEAYPIVNNLQVKYADDKFKFVESKYIGPYKHKLRMIDLSILGSPVSLSESIFMRIAETSHEDFFRYYDYTLQYRTQLLNYFNDKHAFSSYKWFTPEDIPYNKKHPAYPDVREYRKELIKRSKLNADEIPVFRYKSLGLNQMILNISPLLLYSLFLIILLLLIVGKSLKVTNLMKEL